MKNCKYCQTEISDKAKICPNCGKKQKGSKLKILIIIALIFIIGSVLFPKDKEPYSEEKTNQTTKKETKKTFLENEIVNYKDVKYSIIEVKRSNGKTYDKPAEGKEFIIVKIKIENNTKEKISYNIYDWKMENSKGQEEGFAFTTIDSDTNLSSGDLNKGGYKEGTIVFEQPKGDKNLKLKYYENILKDEFSFEFKLK